MMMCCPGWMAVCECGGHAGQLGVMVLCLCRASGCDMMMPKLHSLCTTEGHPCRRDYLRLRGDLCETTWEASVRFSIGQDVQVNGDLVVCMVEIMRVPRRFVGLWWGNTVARGTQRMAEPEKRGSNVLYWDRLSFS